MNLKNILSLRTWYLAFKNGYLIYKIHGWIDDEEYKKALDGLDKMYRTKNYKFEIDMLKAQIFDQQSRHHECLTLAQSLINQIKTNKKINAEEKKYCTAYLLWIAAVNGKKVHADKRFENEIPSVGYLSQIKLDNIPQHWKKNFPLRIHPDWKRLEGLN